MKDVDGGGEGAVIELTDDRLGCWAPTGNGDGGANCVVGVGVGVLWAEAGTFAAAGCAGDGFVLVGPISPLYTSPSSPGANESVEQKPSDEDITRVSPSLDLMCVSNDHSVLAWGVLTRRGR